HMSFNAERHPFLSPSIFLYSSSGFSLPIRYASGCGVSLSVLSPLESSVKSRGDSASFGFAARLWERILLPNFTAHGDGEKVRPSFPVCGEYLPSLGLVCRPTPVVGLVSLLGVIEKQDSTTSEMSLELRYEGEDSASTRLSAREFRYKQMASRTSLALFLAVNLLLFTYTSATCYKDSLQLGVCANVLKLVDLTLGNPPVKPCCSLIAGLADLEAAVCLCTVLKANILGIKLNLPINLSVLLNVCSRKAPKNFQCA
ncbi:hypothetical protein HID58_052927, partial [Brassica napus]